MSELIHRRSKSFTLIIWVFVFFWIVAAGFPFLWTMWGSFKVQGDFFSKADWGYTISGLRTQIETGSSFTGCLLYTSPSPRDGLLSRMPSSA